MKKKSLFTIAVLSTVLLLAACGNISGKNGGPGADSKQVVISTIHKNPNTPTPTTDPDLTGNPEPTGDIPTPTQPAKQHTAGTFSAADMQITLDGVHLECGMDFLPFVDSMAMKPEIIEGMACLDDGKDTNYVYGRLYSIFTLAGENKQVIYDIYVTGSNYTDDCGVRIGTTKRSEVNAIYGEPSKVNPSSDKYEISNDVYMSFEYEDDIVTAIDICNMNVK